MKQKIISDHNWRKAKSIIINNEIHLLPGSTTTFWHFVVKNNNKATDVFYFYNKKTRQYEYSCTAIDKSHPDKRKWWGCSMSLKRRDRPFCSHTLAVRLFIKDLFKERY